MLDQSTFRKSWLYLIGAAAAWGFASAISKRAVEEIPPLTLFPIQLGVSLVALGTIVTLGRTRPERPGGIRTLAWLGVLNPGVAYSLGLVGLTQITASLSVVLWATEPLLILGLAVLILKERVASHVAVASAAAVGGVYADRSSVRQGWVVAWYCPNPLGRFGMRLLHNRGQTPSGRYLSSAGAARPTIGCALFRCCRAGRIQHMA